MILNEGFARAIHCQLVLENKSDLRMLSMFEQFSAALNSACALRMEVVGFVVDVLSRSRVVVVDFVVEEGSHLSLRSDGSLA